MIEATEDHPLLHTANVTINPIFIDSKSELEKQLPFLRSCSKIGIDVEFPAMKRYEDRISLIQIGNETKQLLIDSESFLPKDLEPILASTEIKKLFFDCAQDINMIKELLDCQIRSIIDVQQLYSIENKLTNNIGLDRVINTFYGNIIDREHKHKYQKFDWRRRPLPAQALTYAASDVTYLVPITNYLETQLQEKNLQEQAKQLENSYELIKPPAKYLTHLFFSIKIGNVYKTDLEKILALRLHRYRSELAKVRNLPFYFVINRQTFDNLVSEHPQTKEGVKDILPQRLAERSKFVKSLLKIITTTINDYSDNPLIYYYEFEQYKKAISRVNRKNIDVLEINEFIQAGMGNTYFSDLNKRIEILKKWRSNKAYELGMHAEMVLPTLSLKHLCKVYPDQESMSNVKGIGKHFWENYNQEINFWLENSSIPLNRKNSI